MRLIAERLLRSELRGQTYLQGELSRERPRLPPPRKRFHVCCSPHNHGALEVLKEMSAALNLRMEVTDNVEHVGTSVRFLIYLNRVRQICMEVACMNVVLNYCLSFLC